MDESFGRKTQPIPEIPEEIIKKIGLLIKEDKVKKVLLDLKICEAENDESEILENIKSYVLQTMLGKYHLRSSINHFFEGINFYLENTSFSRDEETGMIMNYNELLPVKSKDTKLRGTRTISNVLGPDRKEYIYKDAEGLRYSIADKKNAAYGKYNPIMAQAIFEFLGEPAAEILLEYGDKQHSYILSKSFLRENQNTVKLENLGLEYDENNKITHEKILDKIQTYIEEKVNAPKDKIENIVEKIKLQYAKQETLKKLVNSIDENLGNTSLIITTSESGEIEDVDMSPAYDMDLSFALGKEIENNDYSAINYYRTNKEGKYDLYSIIKEFCKIQGYKEKIEEFTKKFNNNYVSNIFEIAYENSKIEKFKSAKDEVMNAKEESQFTSSYKTYLIDMVGKLKDIYKRINEEEKTKM